MPMRKGIGVDSGSLVGKGVRSLPLGGGEGRKTANVRRGGENWAEGKMFLAKSNIKERSGLVEGETRGNR